MLTYRPAAEHDFEFLWDLHRQELRPHIEALQAAAGWRWRPARQRQVLRAFFQPQCARLVLLDGRRAGALQVTIERCRLVLDYIAIARPHQGRGLGCAVLRHLQDHASHLNRPIELQVLVNNPAVRLYKRLGFVTRRTTTLLYWLRWEPPGWMEREFFLQAAGYPPG